jgi:hypothetical protein
MADNALTDPLVPENDELGIELLNSLFDRSRKPANGAAGRLGMSGFDQIVANAIACETKARRELNIAGRLFGLGDCLVIDESHDSKVRVQNIAMWTLTCQSRAQHQMRVLTTLGSAELKRNFRYAHFAWRF